MSLSHGRFPFTQAAQVIFNFQKSEVLSPVIMLLTFGFYPSSPIDRTAVFATVVKPARFLDGIWVLIVRFLRESWKNLHCDICALFCRSCLHQ
jgi:hypothetical protein